VLVDLILTVPLGLRLIVLAVVGAAVGGQLNRGIYRLAWHARSISPWSSVPRGVASRSWFDRIPIVGWLTLRREAPVQGRGFWIRPLLIELGTAAAFALLYWLETERFVLWPIGVSVDMTLRAAAHQQFLAHAVMLSLMIVATFIDFDEQTIPDGITVTGTIVAFGLIVALPWSTLPTMYHPAWHASSVHHLVFTSTTYSPAWHDGLGGPMSWPPSLDQYFGLTVTLASVWIWCFAIMHKTWTLRHGPTRAVRYLVASIVRRGRWILPVVIGVALSVLVVGVWRLDGSRWQALASSVIGMAFGGGLIWLVRIVAGEALQVEAMGFGDVTLMAMIGAFLGWQPALLVFFLAPFTAIAIALAQWALTGDRHIAFGPYLCLAAVLILLGWRVAWYTWAMPLFALGWFVPGVVGCCLVMMGGLLWFWRIVRDAVF